MTYKYRPWLMVFTYSLAHFIVDLACSFLSFSRIVGDQNLYMWILLYNFCAFALQMPIGLLADIYNKNYIFAILGCLLVATAYITSYQAFIATLLLGIGNAFFHIGGGVDILNISDKKSSALGIFVSPGALGLYFGKFLGNSGSRGGYFLFLGLLLIAGTIYFSYQSQGKQYPQNPRFSVEDPFPKPYLFAAISFFIVVCLRSYVGLAIDFPWKGSGSLGILLVLAVVAGKAAGGIAADRFGLIRVSLISLIGSALLLLFPNIPALGIISLLLFNMTMPITLWAMSKIFPAAKGLSFGLLTFGLFIGYLPKYFGWILATGPWLFSLLALTSLALLYQGISKVKL